MSDLNRLLHMHKNICQDISDLGLDNLVIIEKTLQSPIVAFTIMSKEQYLMDKYNFSEDTAKSIVRLSYNAVGNRLSDTYRKYKPCRV